VRIVRVATVTLGGVLVAQVYPPAYLVAVGVCVVVFAALLRATRERPQIGSLRHAAIGAGALALIALIVGLLLAFGADLPLEVRNQLRTLIMAAAFGSAVYWLDLLATGGFDVERWP